jgi:hypothetical protein
MYLPHAKTSESARIRFCRMVSDQIFTRPAKRQRVATWPATWLDAGGVVPHGCQLRKASRQREQTLGTNK